MAASRSREVKPWGKTSSECAAYEYVNERVYKLQPRRTNVHCADHYRPTLSLRKVLRRNRNRRDNVICHRVTRSVCSGVINTRLPPTTSIPFLDSPPPTPTSSVTGARERERRRRLFPKRSNEGLSGGVINPPFRGGGLGRGWKRAGECPANPSGHLCARMLHLVVLKNIGELAR